MGLAACDDDTVARRGCSGCHLLQMFGKAADIAANRQFAFGWPQAIGQAFGAGTERHFGQDLAAATGHHRPQFGGTLAQLVRVLFGAPQGRAHHLGHAGQAHRVGQHQRAFKQRGQQPRLVVHQHYLALRLV